MHLEALVHRVCCGFLLLFDDSRHRRRFGAAGGVELDLEVVRGHTGDLVRGSWSFPTGDSRKDTLVECMWLGGSLSCVDGVAPDSGLRH